MAVATPAELSEHTAEYLELVELGGRVTIRRGDEIVGELVPTPQATHRLLEMLAELPAQEAEAAQALFLGEGAIDQGIMDKVKEKREHAEPSIPKGQEAIYAHTAKLIAEGKARPPLAPLPDDFFTQPRSKVKDGSVLEDLLAARREARY